MKRIFYVSILIAVLVLLSLYSGCTLHIPSYDYEWDNPVYRVRLLVDPDDAVVLLNGKLKGYAYEFSSWDSSLRLASRNNEIIIKKEGYVEEVVDLYEYYSRKITVRMKLLEDKDYVKPVKKSKVEKPAKVKPVPVAKPEPQKEFPEELEKEIENDVKPVDVVLEIFPEESSIYLNGKFWGISPKIGKIENFRLKPGKYTLEVVKPGYKTYKKKLEISDQKLSLSIKLIKEE